MTGKSRVMIVEDEAIIAMDIRSTVEGLGYTVPATASSGDEALSKVDDANPDIILMDIKIAGEMDGIETAQEINETHNIPIIYITSYSDEKTLERAMDTRPYSYILKPIRERDLAVELKLALHSHKMELKLIQAFNELQKSNEKLEMLDDMKNDTIMSISNNIQMQISDASDAINHAMRSPGQNENKSLSKAKQVLFNQTRMLDDMRGRMEISDDTLIVSTSVFNLNDLAALVSEDLHADASNMGIDITLPEEKVTVKADYYKIKYLISILIKHALNLSKKKGKLDIRISEEEDRIKLSICDNGTGIPFEGQEMIFDDTLKPEDIVYGPTARGEFQLKGSHITGVKEIIHAHNGMIGVEGDGDTGIRYFFTLPLRVEEPAPLDRYEDDVFSNGIGDHAPYTPS